MAKRVKHSIFERFLQSGNAGGFLLIGCVLCSLLIANSVLKDVFAKLLEQRIGLETEGLSLRYTTSSWINDGLMTIFFLLVGLEIKRELFRGELSSFKKASLPVMAAVGGMVFPALIYSIFNFPFDTAEGWGIPMATDIAFALAIISLLHQKVPASLKIFLAALAIADDLGAVLVIAIFYTKQLAWNFLFIGLGIWLLLLLFNRLGVKRLIFYLIPGLLIWYFIHHSGIHATIAGVLVAFAIPLNSGKASPLEKLEHALTTPVNFLIMPIFALANTNITFSKNLFQEITSPLSLGIIFGLLIGKTVGVTLFSWIAVKLKLAKLPHLANWKHVLGIGMLAGIGFTMSIFISTLSFDKQQHVEQAKFAILVASVLAGIFGFTYLKRLQGMSTK